MDLLESVYTFFFHYTLQSLTVYYLDLIFVQVLITENGENE